jgi:hypothetical protein
MISIQLEIMADVKALSDLGDRMGYVYLIAITIFNRSCFSPCIPDIICL